MPVTHMILTKDDLSRIHEIPTIRKERYEGQGIFFTAKLPADIHQKVSARLGIPLAKDVPFRWMRGDIPPHSDLARDGLHFDFTHLIYLSDSAGFIVIGGDRYEIRAGDAYCFSEGVIHGTIGATERLIMGPFNERSVPVGFSGVYYTDNTAYFSQATSSGSLLSIPQINTIGGSGTPFPIPAGRTFTGWTYYAPYSYGTNFIGGITPADGDVFAPGSSYSTTGGIFLQATFGDGLIVFVDDLYIQLTNGRVIPAGGITACELIEKIGLNRTSAATNEFFYQRSRANNTIPSRNGFATR